MKSCRKGLINQPMPGIRHSQRKRERVIKEFRRVGRVDLACAAAGVDRTTHYWWMKHDTEYKKAFQEACEEVGGLLEDEAVRRAYHGTVKPMSIGGKMVMVTEFNDQLLMFLLKCRHPKVFGRREDTVHIDGQLSVAEIIRNRRQQRLAEEAAADAAAKAAAIPVTSMPALPEAAAEAEADQDC
jgi:hypothetical protein